MLRFSRRFGQPAATLAGLAASTRRRDRRHRRDLQDPPELIPEMVARWREGYDVVYAQRRTREGETLPKRIVAALGYRVIKRIAEVEIPPNTGDFRLMSRRVVDHVVSLNEAHGFLRGLVALVGFKQTAVLYDRDARAAGDSKYNQFIGSIFIGMNGDRELLALPAAADLGRRDARCRCSRSCSRSATSSPSSPASRSRSATRRSSSSSRCSAASSCSRSGSWASTSGASTTRSSAGRSSSSRRLRHRQPASGVERREYAIEDVHAS